MELDKLIDKRAKEFMKTAGFGKISFTVLQAERLIKSFAKQQITLFSIFNISESKFIDQFTEATDGDLWEYEDWHDYSKGMKRMDSKKVTEIGKELYNSFFKMLELEAPPDFSNLSYHKENEGTAKVFRDIKTEIWYSENDIEVMFGKAATIGLKKSNKSLEDEENEIINMTNIPKDILKTPFTI